MKGAPATAGSLILKGYMPPYDATAVTRLEAAGAVLLGKLNCDEFAMGSSNENSAYGPVLNPRALDRVPGGSSGGSRGGGGRKFRGSNAGDRYWRVDSAAGGFLWGGWGAAYVWSGESVWVDCVCLIVGSSGTVDQECEGRGDGAASYCRKRCYGCDFVGSPGRGLCRRRWRNRWRGCELGCRRSTLARVWTRRFVVQLMVYLLV